MLKLTKRVLAFSLSGAIALNPFQIADANQGNKTLQQDERQATLVLPPMIDAWFCAKHKPDCSLGKIPAKGDDGDQIRVQSTLTYTHTQTTVSGSDGVQTTVSSIDRTGPASFKDIYGGRYRPGFELDDSETIYADAYIEEPDPSADGRWDRKFIGLSLEDGSIADFMRNNGDAIGAGLNGYLGYLEQRQMMHKRQAQAASELERAYREGLAINGRYVRAVEREIAARARISEQNSTARWLNIGMMVSQVASADRTGRVSAAAREYQRYLQLANSPYVARAYAYNEIAVKNVSEDFRKKIRNGQYRQGLGEIEGLQYNTNDFPLPKDIDHLINPEGIVLFENNDPSIPDSPLSQTDFQTDAKSELGQVVRRTVNHYQAVWAESKGLTNWTDEEKIQYVAGLIYLQAADQGLAEGQSNGVTNLIMSNALLQGALGFAEGVKNSITEFVQLVPDMAELAWDYAKAVATDPSRIIKSVTNLVDGLPLMKDALLAGIMSVYDTAVSGSSRERGQLLGRLGFEVALALGTGGVGTEAKILAQEALTVVKATTAGRALAKATASLSLNSYALSAGAAKAKSLLQEVVHLSKDFRGEIFAVASKDSGRALDALGAYLRMLQAGSEGSAALARTEAAKVAEVVLRHENKNGRKFLNSVITSQANPHQRAKYFRDADDAQRILKTYNQVDQRMNGIKGERIEGFVSRASAKKWIDRNTSEAVFDHHIGNITSSGRYKVGGAEGQFVQSSGFGKTPAEAVKISQAEMVSYGNDPSSMIQHTKAIKVDNVLALTKGDVQAKLGITANELVIERKIPDSYELTQIIGHVAHKKGFSGVLAPSAVAKGEEPLALHLFK